MELDKDYLDQRATRNEEDIKELRQRTEGIPERLKVVEQQICKLTETIDKFIGELRMNYQTKDNCQTCRRIMQYQLDRNQEDIRNLKYVMVAAGSSAVIFIVKYILNLVGLM